VSKQHHHPVGVPSSSLGSKGEKGPALTHRPSFIPMCETCKCLVVSWSLLCFLLRQGLEPM
jgi:hypothetical protein